MFVDCSIAFFRLYITSKRLTNSLKVLGEYIIKLYASMWFTIKMNPSFKEGPKYLFKCINVYEQKFFPAIGTINRGMLLTQSFDETISGFTLKMY